MAKIEQSPGTVIRIPETLAERIRRRLAKSDFRNLDDYVAYVLNQVLDELEGQSKDTEEGLTKKEQSDIESQLRSLGYM